MKIEIFDLSLFRSVKAKNPAMTLRLMKLRLREVAEFDSSVIKGIIGFFGLLLGLLCYACRNFQQAFTLFSGIHSAACSSWTTRIVERMVKAAISVKDGQRRNHPLSRVFVKHAETLQPTAHTRRFFEDSQKLLGSVAIVLKATKPGEKGVICILYSYALPLFMRLFNVERITKDYFLVLEPSWSGYCNMDILCFSQLNSPVFVQAYEPRDAEFIQGLDSNLEAVPVSNNWWVDYRIFRPLSNVTKDIDVIMVAGWADFKRHPFFFHALGKLRRRGKTLKVVLIGYPQGKTKDSIHEEAEFYGVHDQIEIYEWISPEEVNYHFNRAKVHILWSRREGWNRAIIEGMFADVPCILYEGHNYGFPYPYINSHTGCYSSEEELSEKLLWMIENCRQFRPREWALQYMSCQLANEILTASIRDVALAKREPWSEDLVVKINGLHGMEYWNNEDKQKFSADYAFLVSCIRQ